MEYQKSKPRSAAHEEAKPSPAQTEKPSSLESRNTKLPHLLSKSLTQIIAVSAPLHKFIMEIATINHAMQLHSQAIKTRKLEDRNSLIKFLNFSTPSNSGNLHHAHHLFDALPNPDSYLWNTIIRGYTKRKKSQEAMDLFILMQHNELAPNPDEYTYPSLLKACVKLGRTDEGKQLHALIYKSGLQSNMFIQNSLVHMYSSCGESYSGIRVFENMGEKDVISWTSMINGYVDDNCLIEALELFERMQRRGVEPNRATMLSVLKACGGLGRTDEGKQSHALIYKVGLQSNLFIQNSLIHVYSSCGELDSATSLFEKVGNKDVVSWTSMIDGYVNANCPTEALKLFERMQSEGPEPNDATVVSVLKACAAVGALSIGKKLHLIVEQNKKLDKVNVRTALIDTYAKCGCIDAARDIFNSTVHKDAFAWTAMIYGLANHGQCRDAINLFGEMVELDVRPNSWTFTAVLSACRIAGLVKESYSYFNEMELRYGIKPTIHHYGCMVNLLSRAGHLNDAERFLKRIPTELDTVLWRNMIWACKIHGDTERSERLMNQAQLLREDSTDTGSYVLLGNVYASSGKWHEKAKVIELMNKKGLTKPRGLSTIEVKGIIHEFSAGDTGHAEAQKIYRRLDEISEQLRVQGYHPKLSEVMLDVDDEEKAFQLHHHSEKLALAYGLISTSAETKIRIFKNLRSCEDCHTVMKLISKMHQREIIMRDRIRFHQFKNGECSCNDNW